MRGRELRSKMANEVKYSVRNKEELEFLENAHKKLMKYYEIEAMDGLQIESTFSGVRISPLQINSEILKVQRNNLEIVLEDGENFCGRCSLLFKEEKAGYNYYIDIKGTHYHIKLKHKFDTN